jgi:hypothetical protein
MIVIVQSLQVDHTIDVNTIAVFFWSPPQCSLGMGSGGGDGTSTSPSHCCVLVRWRRRMRHR